MSLNIYNPFQYELLKADYTNFATVAAITNTYTLDLSANKNFYIETTDANAKAIVLSNVPSEINLIIQVSVKLKYTNAAAITHPEGVVWKDAATPVFTAGKRYIILYTSYDNGTTWLSSVAGAW